MKERYLLCVFNEVRLGDYNNVIVEIMSFSFSTKKKRGGGSGENGSEGTGTQPVIRVVHVYHRHST